MERRGKLSRVRGDEKEEVGEEREEWEEWEER